MLDSAIDAPPSTEYPVTVTPVVNTVNLSVVSPDAFMEFPVYVIVTFVSSFADCVIVCVVDVVTLSAVLPEMVTVLVTDVSPVF